MKRKKQRAVTQRPELLLAEIAVAAGDVERNDDAVADLELAVSLTDLDDFAHGFMAENVA